MSKVHDWIDRQYRDLEKRLGHRPATKKDMERNYPGWTPVNHSRGKEQ